MKNLILILVLSLSMPFNLHASDKPRGKAFKLYETSLEFVEKVESTKNGPLYDAYICVYIETFTEIIIKENMTYMMKNILNELIDSTSIIEVVDGLIKESDPKFFDKLLTKNTSEEPLTKKCNAEISLAKKQEYVDELIIKKTLVLATLTILHPLFKKANNE